MNARSSSGLKAVAGVLLLMLLIPVLAACGGTPAASPTAVPATAVPATAEATTEATPEATTEATPEATAEPTPVAENQAVYTEGDLLAVAAKECGNGYTGQIKEIVAVDASTVKFVLCAPDPAFRAKAAFTPFSILPSEYLESTGGTGDLIEKPIGTGPYMIDSWVRGDSITLKRFDGYWGEPANTETVVIRWSSEAAQRLLELQSGTVDGIDNPAPDAFEVIANDSTLQLKERPGLNVFYVGMNNAYPPFDNEKVRQALAIGIDRQRIVENFYPAGSEVATHFTPCAIPNGCAGDAWPEYDLEAAKALLAEAGFPDGFETTLQYRDVVRGYLPEPGRVAEDIQAQLAELGIKVTIQVEESGTYLDKADAGELKGLYLLGWGADFPDITNFLDYHFGAGASKQFGAKFDDLTAALQQGASKPTDVEREPFYVEANNLLIQHVPMVPIAHGASGTAYKGDVAGAHSSPLTSEYFAVMAPGDRDTFVWLQNGEPAGLYCADETDGEALRTCEQITEALLSYEIGGTAVKPGLAESCDPNTDLTEWTCKLRTGVKFHDGSDFDANDVVMSFAVQWDAANPLHVGRDGSFTYFSSLWGGFLNAPAE
ncbi:ABC transporter substrate binding protein (dipeptide) [Oscillochloris trichoides DG-6]|uniref:ABC transporter substrate binding protein (Dipeptide) n=1 Tax=Oscillochloris trichoides DG-6 TaxID=765420 RepID=E1IA56_9CHLR|nr:ABC transporter substrate-binding protein [Oscillochloris trichoides]EFO82058.1 ABC transporter substrate binding protein (dipeptide) [Oscillochloris trichoides DG-6]